MKTQKSRFGKTALCFIVALLAVPSLFGSGVSRDEPSAVAVHMKAINQGFRELRRQLNEPGMTDTKLALIAEIKEHIQGAQKEEPDKVRDIPESQQEAFIKDYKVQMDEVVKTLNKLAAAVKEEKLEEASALLKKLNDQKKKGHGKFQE